MPWQTMTVMASNPSVRQRPPELRHRRNALARRKKISRSDIIGDKGIALIHRLVLDMGFVWNPTGLEAGIDGYIEIRDEATGEVANCILQVQSKATAWPFAAETDASFSFLCDERDLDYWLGGNAPVILIVSRPDTNEAYWVSIKDYFSRSQPSQAT